MDFDLFELDEDDEILSSMCIDPTQHQVSELTTNVLAEFNCIGADAIKSQFSNDGFIKNCFILTANSDQKNYSAIDEITLTSYEFQSANIHSKSIDKFVFGEAFMNIQYLMTSVKGPIGAYDELSFYQRRRQVSQLLHMLLHKTTPAHWTQLRQQVFSLNTLLSVITNADTWKLIYFANSSKGNECNVPAYQLLHGVLEWKLLLMFILQKYETKEENKAAGTIDENPATPDPLILHLERIFEDLITCSLYHFSKKHSTELLFTSPFPCTCFKEFWLMLQLFLQREKLYSNINFWAIFNKVMEKLKCNQDLFSLNQLSYCEFANWIIAALTRLFGYRSNGVFEGPQYTRATVEEAENYSMLEQCTLTFFNSSPNEEQSRIFICILMPILLEWWRPKVNVAQLLWEHFHKRLNSSFYIAGAPPANLAVACSSGKSYLEKYRQLLKKDQLFDANLSSYTLFTLFLGKTLERLLHAELNNHAQKLLGRIYTKFSLQKFLTLNETGIHHLIELFLVLALSGDFVDLAPKLRDKLLSIALDKVTIPKQIAVIKGHMAMLILFAENSYDISDYVVKLLQQLAAVRYDLSVSKIIADALLDIFEHADDFKRGEAMLIDTWLPNFLASCTPSEQERTFEALHLIFVKLKRSEILSEQQGTEVQKALNMHILPFLKQQFISNYSQWVPQLAADFCIYSCFIESNPKQAFERLFKFFIEMQSVNRQALPKFLCHVLESDKRNIVSSSTIMHVWFKSLVLLTAVNEDVSNLTKIVVHLPEFKWITQLEPDEVLNAKEPMCVFVAAVGKHYDNCKDYQQRRGVADAFNDYLKNFDKWLQLDLKAEKSEMAFRFYSFIAIIIYNCSQIVYAKSKINCFFHIAITRFVLTTNIQMGKPPEGKLAQLIHKIWPVLVQGIGRLNFKSDPYITKTLTDLIQKWTPNFKISPNSKIVARPFITCLQGDNYELCLFIFEKLTNLFLTTQRRQADPNACLIITIYQEIVDAVSTSVDEPKNEKRFETFLKGTCIMILDHVMMVDELVPSRALLLELLRRITNCEIFSNSSNISELFLEHLRIITKRHLAYYTFFYFELLMKIAQFSFVTIEKLMSFLLEEVRIVEEKRGAGEDNRIRGCLQKLQVAITTAKHKNINNT